MTDKLTHVACAIKHDCHECHALGWVRFRGAILRRLELVAAGEKAGLFVADPGVLTTLNHVAYMVERMEPGVGS